MFASLSAKRIDLHHRNEEEDRKTTMKEEGKEEEERRKRKRIGAFEVLAVRTMKCTIFWIITPCSSIEVRRCLAGTYRLHLQDR
jgi:hypothetical protein